MRVSTMVSGLVGVILMVGLAAPAAAQGKVDFSAGYQYFQVLQAGAEKVPAGWATSVAVGKAWVKFVADVAGNYKDNEMFHTYQAGVEFSGKGNRVVPFARLLLGFAVASDIYDAEVAAVFTPEAGVKLMATDRIGFQTSVGFPVIDQGGLAGFRFFAGIVVRR